MIHPSISPQALIRLGQVMQLWEERGAQVVTLPWMASASAMNATRPPERAVDSDISTPFGFLVASGEQAFLDLWTSAWKTGQMRIGWTPCFRHEPQFDATHHYCFCKAEVFVPVTAQTAQQEVDRVRLLALEILQQLLDRSHQSAELKCVQTEQGYDIECNGVEVGSYGARHHHNNWYVFGTALAEPRWSTAVAKTASAL